MKPNSNLMTSLIRVRKRTLWNSAVITVFALYGCGPDENIPSPAAVIGGGQTTEYDFYHFTPKVVSSETIGDVTLEMRNSLFGPGNPVLSTPWGADIALKDDGKGGDIKANDQVFTTRIDSKLILDINTPGHLNKPLLGRIQFMQGGFTSIFAEVWNDEFPLVNVTSISSSMQKSAYLVNISTDSTISPDKHKEYLKLFYSKFGDDYDFIVIIFPGFNLNRNFRGVKNEVEGIGIPQFDIASQFGSAGRLKGIVTFPNTTLYDGASRGYQHELGHNWINFLDKTPFESGIPHWPLSDLASGIMGYSPGGGQGLLFPKVIRQNGNTWFVEEQIDHPGFNDLELYLMGLIPAAEVSPHIVFDNQSQTPRAGGELTGSVTTVTYNDIISAFGHRVPNATNSTKQFNIGTIIISTTLLTAKEMSFYEYYTRRAELTEQVAAKEGHSTYLSKPFYLSTGKRASITTRLVQ